MRRRPTGCCTRTSSAISAVPDRPVHDLRASLTSAVPDRGLLAVHTPLPTAGARVTMKVLPLVNL
ncbi:hypothetical protein SCOCK_360017 [Actinacidiphila cocklensis]|uniref:Uncharacterized protein n=1 Tax=Actinacidiphila cocklensis TaxID=887465 RepID=A0A9W4DT86_9ACTN|nr:hypothetical protein SCOCK_360017 [Actinacidiphila cocklensis]